MKTHPPRQARGSSRRPSRKDTLIQTRVPTANAKVLRDSAKIFGTTMAGYLRKMIIDATAPSAVADAPTEHFSRPVDVDFLFEEGSDGEHRALKAGQVQSLSAVVPFSFQLDAIVFEGEYIIHSLFVGNDNTIPFSQAPNTLMLPTTDYPGGRLDLSRRLGHGILIAIQVSADQDCQFRARLLGRRAAPRQLAKTDARDRTPSTLAIINIGGNADKDVVPSGAIRDFRARYYAPFQCERIVTDNHAAFTLLGAEVGRDPQIDAPLPLDHSTPLALLPAYPAEEIRLFVQNTSDAPALFSARLHGSMLD